MFAQSLINDVLLETSPDALACLEDYPLTDRIKWSSVGNSNGARCSVVDCVGGIATDAKEYQPKELKLHMLYEAMEETGGT